MFYVSYTDIYLMEYDESLGVYPKVELHKNPEGHIYMKKLSTGVALKPSPRQVCTMEEIIAQLGNTIHVDAEDSEVTL